MVDPVVKAALEKQVRAQTSGYVGNLFNALKREGMEDIRGAVAYWNDLVRIGIIDTIIGSGPGAVGFDYQVSESGLIYLATGDAGPHDPTGFVRSLLSAHPSADGLAVSCFEEAAVAWAHGLYRSSAVMLGCACERLILVLSDAVESKGIQPFASNLAKFKTEEAKGWPVSVNRRFNEVREALKGKGILPPELADAIDRKLTPIFEHARGLRNDAGHPTSDIPTQDEARASLLLFSGFCGLVIRISGALS